MKLPRDISARDLVAALGRLEYQVTHQTGSHVRLTTLRNGEHHLTLPNHNPIRVGTFNSILRDLGEHHRLSRNDLLAVLFG